MPRNTTFRENWLSEVDCNGHNIGSWCTKDSNPFKAHCFICKKTFDVKNSGIQQILQHASTSKHKSVASVVLSKQQSKFTLSVTPGGKKSVSFSSPDISTTQWNMDHIDKVVYAEALWCLKVVDAGYSFQSCDKVDDIFKEMFSDSSIAKSFTLGSTKVSYEIAHGLGPHFHSERIEAIKNSNNFYSIAFDEATTDAGKKQLDIHVRYWDDQKNHIVNYFLCCYELGHSTSDVLKEKLLTCLSSDGLPLNRLLTISSDGPPVNLKCLRDLDSHLESEGLPALLKVGTCNLHIVHNSFRRAMLQEISHWEIDEFLDSIFKFFHKFPTRKEDFKDIHSELGTKAMRRFVANRWLSIVPVITTVINQWDALKEYFLTYIPSKKSSERQCQTKLYRFIKCGLEDSSSFVRLLFLKSVGESFEKFLRLMQHQEPLVHILYDELCELIRSFLSRIVKSDILNNISGSQLNIIDLKSKKNVSVEEIEVGTLTRKEAMKLKEQEKKYFFTDAKKFIVCIIQYLVDKTPLNSTLLRNLKCLHPLFQGEHGSLKCIQKVAEQMPLVIKVCDIDKLKDEWKYYMAEEMCMSPAETRINVYWSTVLQKTNSFGELKYVFLSKVVKAALTIYHGQADVERGFSSNK